MQTMYKGMSCLFYTLGKSVFQMRARAADDGGGVARHGFLMNTLSMVLRRFPNLFRRHPLHHTATRATPCRGAAPARAAGGAAQQRGGAAAREKEGDDTASRAGAVRRLRLEEQRIVHTILLILLKFLFLILHKFATTLCKG